MPELKEGEMMLDLMNGFLAFVSRIGKILYVSENAIDIIGFGQVSLTGVAASKAEQSNAQLPKIQSLNKAWGMCQS